MNKTLKYLLAIAALIMASQSLSAQEWVEKMNDKSVNFYEVVEAYESHFEGKSYEKGKGMKQFERWRYFMEPRVYPSGNRLPIFAAYDEVQAFAKKNKPSSGNKTANWQAMGPVDWQSFSYNPGLGRVNAIRVDPNDTSIYYIGTPAGGCWKTTDAGQTWLPISDNLPVIGVSDIAINPSNSNEIYISTGDGDGNDTYSLGVLKSLDQGLTWSNTNLQFFRSQNVSSRKLLINPLNPSVLWVATSAGLFKTNDGGASWVSVLAGNIRNVKMKPGDTSTVYVSSDQFYRSTDGGNNFSQITTGISPDNQINRMEIAVTAANPNYVYAVAGKQSDAGFEGLYRSTNSGLSFVKMSSSPNILSYAANGSGTGGQSWYDLAIAVNQSNALEVYVGGINVWKSTNGGSSWNITSHWLYPSNVGYTHADIHALEWYNGKIYCGSDGGIFRSSDNATNWVDISDGLQIMQFYQMAQTEQDASVVLGGAQDNGCNYRNSQGNWVHILGADGMNVEIDPSNISILYFSSQNGGINRSYNAGQSRTNISTSIRSVENGAWVTPFQLDPNNTITIYAAYENVWKSSNRGDSWQKISNFSGSATLRQLKVAPSNSNIIYTCGNNNLLRKTVNGGTSWAWVNSGLPNLAISDIEVHPAYPDSIWVSFSGYSFSSKVFVSGNGGGSWSNLSTNMPNLPVNDLVYDTVGHTLYAGTDVGIYFQTPHINLGWNAFNTGLPNVIINEMEIHYGAAKLRAATYGRGMWESDLPRPMPTGIKQMKEELAGEFTIAPNPTTNKIKLTWQNVLPQQVSLRDLTGKIILTKTQFEGNQTDFDLAALPNGIYLLEVLSSGKSKNFKVLKTN